MGGARFSQNGHLQREAWLLNIPESFASNVLPSQQATFTPLFPGDPPRTAVRFDPDAYGDFALPWDPVHVKLCVCLLRMGLHFPQSRGAPVYKPHWPSMPDALGALSPNARFPRCGELMWDSELTPVGVSL